TLDTKRQVDRLERATTDLNGQLMSTDAEGLVRCLGGSQPVDQLPREVVLELTARRMATPIFAPAGQLPVSRDDIPVDVARDLFGQLAEADDVRLTLGGVGDPLVAPHLFDIVAAARDAGITALHVRTDLLEGTPEFIERLAAAPI